MRRIRRFARNVLAAEGGVAAVEFAIVAPIFFSLLLGIIDLSRYMWTLNTVQFAVDDAIRTGVIQELTDNQIQSLVEKALKPVDDGSMAVTVASTSGNVSVLASGNYSFMFPISSFLSQTVVSVRSEMPM